MTDDKQMKATSVANLKRTFQKTEIVALRGWTEDEPFVVELRRSTLRLAITAGKIPNSLMAAAQRLYEGTLNSKATATIKQMLEVTEIIVSDAMVDPKLADLKEAGLEMTEEQYSAIFNYAQRGIKAVEPFLFKPADPADGDDGEAMEGTAE